MNGTTHGRTNKVPVLILLLSLGLSIGVTTCRTYFRDRWYATSPYLRKKEEISRTFGWERLRALALELLANTEHVEHTTFARKEDYPPELASLGCVIYVVKEGNGIPHVYFAFGGGFEHYGFLSGPSEFVPTYPFDTEKIVDGVWGMSETGIERKGVRPK